LEFVRRGSLTPGRAEGRPLGGAAPRSKIIRGVAHFNGLRLTGRQNVYRYACASYSEGAPCASASTGNQSLRLCRGDVGVGITEKGSWTGELHAARRRVGSLAPIRWGPRELRFMRSSGSLFGIVCTRKRAILRFLLFAFCVQINLASRGGKRASKTSPENLINTFCGAP
jgi:hypothetical protein